MASLLVFDFLFLFLIGQANSSHFRGGILSWRPTDANPPAGVLPMVEYSWRISFRKSSGMYCNRTLIDSQTLMSYGGALTCDRGCFQLYAPLTYVCTDFSDLEDWTTGVGRAEDLPAITSFDALYPGSAWITLNNGGGDWILRTNVNLARRPDNGLINSSPTTSNLPIVRFQKNCYTRLVIPVSDADDDFVRCRLADAFNDECGGICGGLDGTELLDEDTCTLEWTPTGNTGWYGYALQIEDYITSTDTIPLSSIPLQFLIYVFDGAAACNAKPTFVSPTPPGGSCILVQPGERASQRIVAAVSDPSRSIVSISTVSPVGFTTTPLQPLPGSQQEYFIDVHWTPLSSISSEEIFCYVAQDDLGLTSEQECIFFVMSATPPKLIQVEPVGDIKLKLVFDQLVQRPTLGLANISITSKASQTFVYTGSTHSSDFVFDNTEIVLLTVPSGTLQTGLSYMITFEGGAVTTMTSCGIPNPRQDFSFTVLGNDKLLCPGDITTNAENGEFYVTVKWQPPVLPDGITAKQVAGPPSSSVTYPIGTKDTIQYVFITRNFTTFVCEFLVTVGPDPHPCPKQVQEVILVGGGGAVVSWKEPVSRDNLLNEPPYPGSFFEVGMHPLCYHFVTVTNDTASCTFNVIVKEETPCRDHVCGNHGTCLPLNVTNFVCVCDGCYYGEKCEKEAHVCNQSRCSNGGICHIYEGSCEQFHCDCPPCFYGQFCELSVDACSNSECQNGASCLPYGDSCEEYTCQCQNCTYGKYCENEIPDPCSLNPCRPGSSCVKLPETCDSYVCVADDDTSEGGCHDQDIIVVENPCNSFPCRNGGSCILDHSGFICLCREGFGGINCEQTSGNFLDLCENSKCANGAECLNSFTSHSYNVTSGQYTCRCMPGFGGVDCKNSAASFPGDDTCNVHNVGCHHNGICRNTYTSTGSYGFICNCMIGFIGQLCDLETTDPCSSNPCRNGATCVSYNTHFTCDCIEGLTGPTCELSEDNATAPIIDNCPGPMIVKSTIPVAVPWEWPKVTDITGYPVPLVDANSAPEAIHEPNSSINVELVYENLSGIRVTCSFVIVVTADVN
ncbi:Neurogenic locus notch-like protein 1 [Holothuria leucospilota]|uniref:Neurogenic locus notch-like protein 1 n=1 Tax=Holothuria leucospilota TaxID=206669 RepID=A0A9Q1H426_HOLLE|nr:Neurogenic locus notch-like protein 1 [Holothuria leucospilota]